MATFNSYVKNYQRVTSYKIPVNHHFPMVFLWFSYGFSISDVPKRLKDALHGTQFLDITDGGRGAVGVHVVHLTLNGDVVGEFSVRKA